MAMKLACAKRYKFARTTTAWRLVWFFNGTTLCASIEFAPTGGCSSNLRYKFPTVWSCVKIVPVPVTQLHDFKEKMPGAGIEPAWDLTPEGFYVPCVYQFRHPGVLKRSGWGRNRTGVHGFAGRYITTLTPSHNDDQWQWKMSATNFKK